MIGKHPVEQWGDLLRWRVVGSLTDTDVAALRDLVRDTRRECGQCFLVADVRELGNVGPDARRAMAEWGRVSPEDRTSGVAAYGCSFTARAIISLTVSAVRLMGYPGVHVKICRDEAEALGWIDSLRMPMDDVALAAAE